MRFRSAQRAEDMAEEAKSLAKISKVMYEQEEADREAKASACGWKLLLSNPKYALFACADSGKKLLVAFQGTAARAGLAHDAMILFNLNEFMPLVEEVIDEVKTVVKQTPHSDIIVTGHSLGGALAVQLAKSLTQEGSFRRVSGHVFNPGSSWDFDKYLTEERLEGITAHHVLGDILSAGWSKSKMVCYKAKHPNPHALANFIGFM
ncbi:Uncharacterized protein SCF082_LOCUS49057 [Durusdinium trenchii]